MARVYADVNAILGPAWYDYGPLMLLSEHGRSLLNGTCREHEDRVERARSLRDYSAGRWWKVL